MKKSLKLLICVILIVIFTFTLCACDGGKPMNEENCDSGHNLVQSSYTAPTCKTTGEEVKKCSRCGFESKTTLLTIGHNYEVKSTTESTCTTRGSQTSECSMCHETKITTLDLKEHDYKLISNTPSTCAVKGHNDYRCNDCSTTKTEELDLADHTYEVFTTEATCFTHGNKKEICSVCNDTKLINETPLLTHSFEADGYCSKCGIFETLFDEDLLNTTILSSTQYNTKLSVIKGDFVAKFNNSSNIPNIYWKEHIVTITISLFDDNNEFISYQSFNSITFPNGGMAIQCGLGGTTANHFDLNFTSMQNFPYFPLSDLEKCTSFKLELSCEGYKTIEKTYQLTEN